LDTISTTFEAYPHSLSYQSTSLIILPWITCVYLWSIIVVCSHDWKSLETSGLVLLNIILCSCFCEYSLQSSNNSSFTISFFIKSVTLIAPTIEVGTLNEFEDNKSLLRVGTTNAHASTVVVLLGIIFWVDPLPNSKLHSTSLSLLPTHCPSKVFWWFKRGWIVAISPHLIV